jgi:hypothetical protein
MAEQRRVVAVAQDPQTHEPLFAIAVSYSDDELDEAVLRRAVQRAIGQVTN